MCLYLQATGWSEILSSPSPARSTYLNGQWPLAFSLLLHTSPLIDIVSTGSTEGGGKVNSNFMQSQWEITEFQGHNANWLDARNICRERCMDLISIEAYKEFNFLQDIIKQYNLHSVWTSGRLCNFKGCDQPHLKPKNIKGWFWSGSGVTIHATNSTPPAWPRNPWSPTGYFGQFLGPGKRPQPDDAEFLINGKLHEACLSVNNNWFEDGITFHDSACFIPMAFICEDSEPLLRKARRLSPSVPINWYFFISK